MNPKNTTYRGIKNFWEITCGVALFSKTTT